MNFFNKIFENASPEKVIIVSQDVSAHAQQPPQDMLKILYFCSFGLLIFSTAFSWYSTGNLFDHRALAMKQWFTAQEKKKTEEKNKIALLALSKEIDTLQQSKAVVEQAIPRESRPDQVVRQIIFFIKDIQKNYRIELPSSVTWSLVPESDVHHDDIRNLSVTAFSVPFSGEYKAFQAFLERLRKNLRLFDVRSIRSLTPKENGLVSADIVFWAYSFSQ